MKKVISIIVLGLLAVVFFVCRNTDAYPEGMIYNYMSSSALKVLTVNADDYIVMLDANRKMLYDKKSGTTSVLSQSVFDITEQNTNLIGAKNNLLYYIATDRVTGGSAIFEFDLDSLKKKRIDSINKMSDPEAFLGIDEVLGIDTGANDMMSLMMGDIWFNKYGRHSSKEIRSFLTQKDKDNKLSTDVLGGVCTTDEYIFFTNGLFKLYRYSYKDGSFSLLSDEKITDFFITENHVYYYSADKNDDLFVCDYDGKNAEKVTNTVFDSIQVYKDCAYAHDEEGNVYIMQKNNITRIAEHIDTKTWTADFGGVYIYNADKGEIEREMRYLEVN